MTSPGRLWMLVCRTSRGETKFKMMGNELKQVISTTYFVRIHHRVLQIDRQLSKDVKNVRFRFGQIRGRGQYQ